MITLHLLKRSPLIALLLGASVFAASYTQTVEIYNNTANTIGINTGYIGNDITNSKKEWSCSGDPNSGSLTACIAIAPNASNIPSKTAKNFVISSSVKSLPSGVVYLYGGVVVNILNDISTTDEVVIPIQVNSFAVAASAYITTLDHYVVTLGSSNVSGQAPHSPFTSSVEYYNTAGANMVSIIVNNNPLYTTKNNDPV